MVAVLFILLSLSSFPEDSMFRSAGPALTRTAVGPAPLFDPDRRFTLGIDAGLVRFPQYHRTQANLTPGLNAWYCYSFLNELGSYVFLRGGLFPRNEWTVRSASLFSAGLGIVPRRLRFFGLRLAYGTTGSLEFYPGDAYDNYLIHRLNAVDLDISFAPRIGRAAGQLAAGGTATFIQGEFRQDIGGTNLPFSGPVFGWWADASLKFWLIRLNVGLADRTLSLGVGVQVGL